MTTRHRVIHVSPDTKIGPLLDEAEAGTVLLENEGALFRLEPQKPEDISEAYDSEKVIAAIKAFSGTWNDVDVEDLISKLYQAREEGSRPFNRP